MFLSVQLSWRLGWAATGQICMIMYKFEIFHWSYQAHISINFFYRGFHKLPNWSCTILIASSIIFELRKYFVFNTIHTKLYERIVTTVCRWMELQKPLFRKFQSSLQKIGPTSKEHIEILNFYSFSRKSNRKSILYYKKIASKLASIFYARNMDVSISTDGP